MAALQDGMKDVDLEGGSPVEESTAAPEGPSTDRSAEPSSSAIDGILSETREDDIDGGLDRSHDGDIEAGMSEGARERPPEGSIGDPMSGVGEDERPYNYICNLDKVNLGGPGWFNDVFKISVEIDSDRTWMDTSSLSLVPRNNFQRHCKLLDTSQHISGTVTVQAPTSKQVWLAGVTVTFEEHLLTVDSDAGELVGALEAQVALGQFVKGEAKFNFDLDLELLNGHRKWPVRETYVGDLMALRHRIVVTAQRPWYTFNVYSQVPVSMETLSSAPNLDAGQENEEGGPNHVLIISDCNGRCEFDFLVDSFNLSDVLRGTVRFTGVTSPIIAGHLMLLRAEFMYGEASEILVAEHTMLGRRRQNTAPAVSGESEEEQVRRQFMSPFVEHRDIHFVHTQEEGCRQEAVTGDVEMSVEIPLSSLPLTPSHMSLTQDITYVNDEAELVGVRYYIRLILEDSDEAAYWHTHEIFFHRSEASASSRGPSHGDHGYDSEENAVSDVSTRGHTPDPGSVDDFPNDSGNRDTNGAAPRASEDNSMLTPAELQEQEVAKVARQTSQTSAVENQSVPNVEVGGGGGANTPASTGTDH